MPSSTPSIPSSGEGDTTLALAALATPSSKSVPYSSEGPTLPILDGASENITTRTTVTSSKKTAASSSEAERARKRRRLEHGGTAGEKEESTDIKDKKRRDGGIQVLYTPWLLLPSEVCREWDWNEQCISVVYTRNQNFKSGVSRLKSLLCVGGNEASGEKVIAISAQGEATTKLVGILEVVRRVVGTSGVGVTHGTRVKWWMYTCLSSRVISGDSTVSSSSPPEQNTNASGDNQANGDQDEDISMHDVDAEDAEFEARDSFEKSKGRTKSKLRTVPVLTVYMTQRRNPVFAKAFGEESFDAFVGDTEGS